MDHTKRCSCVIADEIEKNKIISKIKGLLHNNNINNYAITEYDSIVIMKEDSEKVRKIFDEHNLVIKIYEFDYEKLTSKNTPADTENITTDNKDIETKPTITTTNTNKKYNIPVKLIHHENNKFSEYNTFYESKNNISNSGIVNFRRIVNVLNMVFNVGMNKYGPLSWERHMDNKYAASLEYSYSAIIRHLSLSATSNNMCDESGLPHLFHVLCRSVMFLTYAYRNGIEIDIDNHPYKEFVNINDYSYIEHYTIPPEMFIWYSKYEDIKSEIHKDRNIVFYFNALAITMQNLIDNKETEVHNLNVYHKSISRGLLATLTPYLLNHNNYDSCTIEKYSDNVIYNEVLNIDKIVYIVGVTLNLFINAIKSFNKDEVVKHCPALEVFYQE